MSSKLRNLFGALTLIVLSLAVSLLVAEGVLRLFPGLLSEAAAVRLHWAEQERESPPSPHRYIGFVPRPEGAPEGADATTASAEAIWSRRNLSPWPKQADVVVVGDSFAYSQTVSFDEAWTVLLDRWLPDARVITLGNIGSGPQQYARVFEAYGAKLSPKLVVVGLFMGNDLYDASIFEQWQHEAPTQDYRRFRMGEDGRGLRSWLEKLGRWSYVAAVARESMRALGEDQFLKGETIELGDGEKVQIVPRFLMQTAQEAVPGQIGFDATLKSVERICTLAEQQGSSCLVVLFPSKEEVYGQFLRNDLPLLAGKLCDSLEQKGIAHVDLGPVFRERARDGLALYQEIDGHPNARGYRLIAEQVLQYLVLHAAQYGIDATTAGTGDAKARPEVQ